MERNTNRKIVVGFFLSYCSLAVKPFLKEMTLISAIHCCNSSCLTWMYLCLEHEKVKFAFLALWLIFAGFCCWCQWLVQLLRAGIHPGQDWVHDGLVGWAIVGVRVTAWGLTGRSVFA